MAHLNSAEGIQNMCATQIMTKSKSLRTGFSSQVATFICMTKNDGDVRASERTGACPAQTRFHTNTSIAHISQG